MKIADLIAKRSPFYSLEFFPPKKRENWPGFFAVLEKLNVLEPLFISVTYGAGGSTQDNTLGITTQLAKSGLVPMAHLTCVGASETGIRTYVEKLLAAGVHNILALRGDVPKGEDIRWEDPPGAFPERL
jgi:5,10-methylenetetrahydrofolate reductase